MIDDWLDGDGRLRCDVCGRFMRPVSGKAGEAFRSWVCTNTKVDHNRGE